MINIKYLVFVSIILFVFSYEHLFAQTDLPFDELGNLKTYSSNEIESSRWSVGGETLDRDYADYHEYKSYLGQSGAKRIRLQGGWAKSEQEKGIYDFEWLDEIIDDALSRGVSPWVQFSYGNPIYEGGGRPYLAGGIPTSEEALEAWDNWVYEMVTRYKDKINEWQIWNEPDISDEMSAEEFAEFYVRTSDIIKELQAEARILGFGLAGLGRTHYVTSILEILKEENKVHYMDALTYHGYRSRPEDHYSQVQELREVVHSYSSEIELWQGENGAPSTPVGESVGALSREDWSELTQAKWKLRRMLGDMKNDVDVTNVFTLSDLWYESGDHLEGYNSKGMLKARPDKTIERPKPSYFAYQHTVSLFSGNIDRVNSAEIKKYDDDLWLSAFQKEGVEGTAIVIWSAEAKPADQYPEKPVNFSVTGVELYNPVLVDLLTGSVYQIPDEFLLVRDSEIEISGLPVADYPLVIVNESWLELKNE